MEELSVFDRSLEEGQDPNLPLYDPVWGPSYFFDESQNKDGSI
jgi:hypothetical protein